MLSVFLFFLIFFLKNYCRQLGVNVNLQMWVIVKLAIGSGNS